ncbi:4-coumarate--CoA ligase-like 3 [Grifola frondosa]|uniref:4-coumarate--CoA ligase-like 3 n=1 Tax=Grifola frondosa TaxID=5627 RepID=A0A1C7MHS8_GRIFR|nr:4-coumarate--CoA ligase-like 3 [Grifola frondosa]
MFPVSQKIGTLGSAGQLVSGTIAKVVKADGSLAGVGEPGELFITGPQITLGYYGNDEATRETYIDGWLRTGDEVLFHENGDIFVVDRIKELIKVKGFQVAPSELEGHLIGHPDVVDVAVVGAPDDYSGEVPLAYVVLKPDTAKAIQENTSLAADVRTSIFKHVADVKSKYKWLAGGVEFIDGYPEES